MARFGYGYQFLMQMGWLEVQARISRINVDVQKGMNGPCLYE